MQSVFPIMLTTRQMLYFEALAEAGHFGRAAERVHVSQPALSAQIAEMERNLGFALVERRVSGAVVTPRGREVLQRVRSILRELRLIAREARIEAGFFNGVLRLGIIPTIAPYLLPNLVPALRTAHAALRLEIKETTTAQLVAALMANEIDAFIAAAPIDEPGLFTKPLFNDRFFVASASDEQDVLFSSAQGGFPVERLLLLEEGHCLRNQALEVCGYGPGRRLVNYGATSLTTLLQMVEHGMGITLVPEIALEAECRHRNLSIIPFGNPAPSRQITLFYPLRAANIEDHSELASIASQCAQPLLSGSSIQSQGVKQKHPAE
jgi:LysR family transcriptional regulator, hydrogen peroxide-inducible genes activator